MKARDVMVSPVITVTPNSSVKELAQTLLKIASASFRLLILRGSWSGS